MYTLYVGKKNEIKSINEAIAKVNGPTTIILTDEEYREKVVVDKPDIIIDGQNKATIIYNDSANVIHADGRPYVTFRTYTLLVKAPHVTLKNLTVVNDAGEGKVVGQAVALHLYNDDINCINCRLIARQDTLFCGPFSPDLIERYIPLLPEDERIHNGEFHQRFENCYIAGTVDFIFGGASADFVNCTIESLPCETDTYIAAPDHDLENEHGMQFINCRIIKSKDTRDESVYLARPWREYGLVKFINCYLDSHIKKQGFSIWEGTDRHKNCRFYEEGSFGPGASNSTRIDWSHVK
jgi:pectinesterase